MWQTFVCILPIIFIDSNMKTNKLFAAIAGMLLAFSGYAQTTNTILENGSYFNGKSFVPFGEIAFKDGKIVSISKNKTSEQGNRIDVKGKYIIPGLIDAHVHIGGSPAYPYVPAEPLLNANSALLCGVTTLVDLFYSEDQMKQTREEAAKSPASYSSLIMAGPILTAPGGHGTEYGVPTRTITSVADATSITGEVIDGGVDVIKLAYEADSSNYIPSINLDMVKAIVAVAHKRGKKVFAHIDRAQQAIDCALAGVDVLAHMPSDALTDAQLKILKKTGVVIIPTITVMQSAVEGHDAKYMSDSLLWRTVNPAYMSNFSRAELKSPFPKERLLKYFGSFDYYQNLANCIKYNIPLLAGTDAGNYAVFYGYSLHNEIAQYVKAGMSNAAALHTATDNLSMVLPDIKTGKIIPGYHADIVVLNSNPLQDINNTKDINMVFHEGEKAKDLISALPKEMAAPEEKSLPYDASVFDLNGLDKMPAYTIISTDAAMGGTSEITPSLKKDNGTYIHLEGKVVPKGYVGFATLCFSLAKDEKSSPVDISAYSAVEFEEKGNGEAYNLMLISSLVKDYNYHMAPFTSSKEWKTIRIPFSDFKQSPFFGTKIDLNLKTIKMFCVSATGKAYPIDLDIKNIHLVK